MLFLRHSSGTAPAHPRRHRQVAWCLVSLVALLAGSWPVGAQGGAGSGVQPSAAQTVVLTVPLVAANYASAGLGNALSRFGVGTPAMYNVNTYRVGALSAGWYWDWMARPDAPRPGGIDYYATIRLKQESLTEYSYTPDAATIARTALANPGTVWFIGNEPDRVQVQDDVVPQVYAAAYGELRRLIKSYDPTALIGAGNIVQSTPARLDYLNQVLDAYQAANGGAHMPVDVWVIHDYPLNEDPLSWGAGVPPGVDPSLARTMDLQDHTNVSLFAQLIVDFRSWMAANGYRQTPLILSEFGVLMPSDLVASDGTAFREPETIAFMRATFDQLLTLTDPNTGYPYDGNRLVQRWAWFCLTDSAEHSTVGVLSGWLYNADTRALTGAGQAWVDYVAQLEHTANLRPISARSALGVPTAGERAGGVYLEAAIVNNGSTSATGVRVQFWDGNALVAQTTIPVLSGGAVPRVVRVPLPAGAVIFPKELSVVVDPNSLVPETDESDNSLTFTATQP